MAYAIPVKFITPFHAVAWQKQIQLADKTASVLNPSVDLGSAAFWLISMKLYIKTMTAAIVFQPQSADVLAGTGNVWNLGAPRTYTITVPAADFFTLWFPRSQQYMNLIQTNAGTWDAEIYATPTT